MVEDVAAQSLTAEAFKGFLALFLAMIFGPIPRAALFVDSVGGISMHIAVSIFCDIFAKRAL
jgi:hypothetical protein